MILTPCLYVIAVTFVTVVFGENPAETETVGNYKYELFNEGKLLSAAITACKNRGAWLVEVKDKDISVAIMTIPRSHDVLIGGIYDGEWKWGDGSSMRYTNWAANAPLSGSSTGQCLLMKSDDGKWRNTGCSTSPQRYVCQSDISYFKGVQITVFQNKVEYTDASTACTDNGSRLVDLKTLALDSYITTIIDEDSWTSGKCNGTSWKWGDGTLIDSGDSRWGDSHPSANKDCLIKTASDGWKSELCSVEAGYICQKDLDAGTCASDVCSNKGSCTISDQRYKCQCHRGYFGTKCEKNIIEISSKQNTFVVSKGETLSIKIDVLSYDENVDVVVVNETISEGTSGITKNKLTGTVTISLGTSTATAKSVEYVIEAISRANNFKSPSLRIKIDIEYCNSDACKNKGTCNDLTTQPYYSCSCTPAFKSVTCEEIVFVEKNNCMYHANHDSKVDFDTATSACHGLNGSLAMIKSSSIHEIIEEQISRQYGDGESKIELRVGGTKRDNTWYWLDGTLIPLTGNDAKWHYSKGYEADKTNLMLSSYGISRPNLRWRATDISKLGYICEIAKTDKCEAKKCENGGTCASFGCSDNTICRCAPGYTGTQCEKDIFTISANINNFTSIVGQNISVTLNITGYNESVKIEVFANSTETTALIIKYNVTDNIEIVIGPFIVQNIGIRYWFRATPMIEPNGYYKFTSINVIVQGPSKIQSITPKTLVIPTDISSKSVVYCTATGVPIPSVYWYKDERLVTSNSMHAIYQELKTGRASLFVKNDSRTDFGLYKCHSYNMINNVKTSSNDTAFLRGKVSFVSLTSSDNLARGRASIICVYEGYPKPDIEWKWLQEHSTTKIDTNQIFSIKITEIRTSGFVNTTSQLNINLAEYLGPAKFSCTGSNMYENVTQEVIEINQNLVLDRNRVFRFLRFNEKIEYSEAQKYCRSIEHNLAKITDNCTQNVLAAAATKFKISGKTYIGGQKQIEDRSSIWRWHDQTFLYNETEHKRWLVLPDVVVDGSYTAWRKDGPGTEGDCLTMRRLHNWQWADGDCSTVSRFICEKNVSGTPRLFENMVDKCSSNLTINWIPGYESNGLRHRMDVTELDANATRVFSEIVIPRNENVIIKRKITDLKRWTSYRITITVCPKICPYPSVTTKTVTMHAGIPGSVDSANVTQINNACIIMWEMNVVRGISGFLINAVSVSLHAESKTYIGKTFKDERKVSNTTKHHHFQYSPNRKYSFSIQAISCAGPGPSLEIVGHCITETGPPPEVFSPNVAPLPNADDTMNITILLPDEINGPISCLFVIVVFKPNRSMEEKISNVEGLKTAMIKTDSESLSENDEYIAIAVPRSHIKNDMNGTLKLSKRLGDGVLSTCNLTQTKKLRRRKRETSSTTSVKAKNLKLENDATYSFYTLSTTPGDGGITYFKTSNTSYFKKIRYSVLEHDSKSYVFIAVVLVVVIVISGFILFAYCRWIKKKRTDGNKLQEIVSLKDINKQDVSEPEYEFIATNDAELQPKTDIPLPQLLDVYNILWENGSAKFYDQFEKLKQMANNLKHTPEIASTAPLENESSYQNILPSDHSRVKLNVEGDYNCINACYINGFSKLKKYIVVQGPLSTNIVDFWKMISEKNVRLIVMLARCMENGKKICKKYWPNESVSKKYGNITVVNTEELSYGCFKLRTLRMMTDVDERTVHQLQLLDWPDHGVPQTTTNLIRFFSAIAKQESDGPVAVHCSDGVGRTGVFIAYNNLVDESESLNSIDAYRCVLALRKQGVDMVQTCDQYMLVHKLILEQHLYGVTDMDPNEIKNMERRTEILSKQFKNLSTIGPMNQLRHGIGEKLSLMNRNNEIFPYESNHVTIIRTQEDSDAPYLNASTIETYGNDLKLIAAQGPLRNTVGFFWRAILDNNINTIVMLTKCTEKNKEQCYHYWPRREGTDIKMGNITVHLNTEDVERKIVRREMLVKRKDKEMTIIQYQYTEWNDSECPGDVSSIFQLIKKMQSSLQRDKDASVLVHCSDGAGRTGTFCAIVNLLERLMKESKIDVFRTVKDLRDCRPGMVQTLVQYQFCFKAVSEYLAMFSLYVNIDDKEQAYAEENPYVTI